MKKLMIAAAIVCAAAMSQAATYDWTITTATDGELGNYEGTGNYSGSGYIFVGAEIGEAAWTALVINGGDLADFASANGGQAISFAGGVASGTYSTPTDLGEADFVTIVADGKGHVFIDDPTTAYWDYAGEGGGSGSVPLAQDWTAGGAYSLNAEDSKEWQEGAWYTAASVPEPTSGLLLLLGVAGLALRRRRA